MTVVVLGHFWWHLFSLCHSLHLGQRWCAPDMWFACRRACILRIWAKVWPVPVSGTLPPASQDGWLDLLRRWLYHWGILFTSWDWGPQGRSESTTAMWQGCWSVQKAFCCIHRNPMALLWMQSVVCSPHPSWPASTQTSGQVRRTTGTPANYWESHQCGVGSRHPWRSDCSISWCQCRISGFHLSFRLRPLCWPMDCMISGWHWCPASPGDGPSCHHICEGYLPVALFERCQSVNSIQSYVWGRSFPGLGHCGKTGVPIESAAPQLIFAHPQANLLGPGD